jgi:DNA/RNA endonuclease YhcR with UshA esterase domain
MDKKELTQEERYRSETHCGSCGRFVGVLTRCPYCLAGTQKRLSIRVFKVLSVIVSTVGLLLLLFYARNVKTPETKIADLGPLSNFAHVRLTGIVTQSYGVHEKWGSLGFVLSDSGADERGQNPNTIRVSAYAQVAKNIQKAAKVPAAGDYISVEGQVRFQKDTASLLINAEEHLEIIERGSGDRVLELELEQVGNAQVGRLVRTTGNVVGREDFATGVSLALDNGTKDGFKVWITKQQLGGREVPANGDLVEVAGKVATFKGAVQINLGKNSDLKLLKKAVAAD